MKLFGKKAQPKKEEPAVLTLYACRKDGKAVPDIACRLFADVMDKIFYTDEDEFQIRFKDGKASTTILDREVNEKEADRERKMRSIAILKEKGIPFLEHLKASVFESECKIPDKEVIIHRLACIFTACVQSEFYTSGQFKNCREMAAEEIAQMEERYQISEWLSPEERDYLENPDKDPALHNRFGWRYECCSVLLWALSMMELKEPTEICDASELGAVMWNHTFDSLMETAVLRSRDEILDMQDLVLRYDWACVDARVHHKEVPMLNSDIVFEWHYALNWLVQADGIADWDRVTTTT